MPKGHPRVSREVKQQVLKRIKGDGVPVAQALGIQLSMSPQGSPWENGYQEAFYIPVQG